MIRSVQGEWLIPHKDLQYAPQPVSEWLVHRLELDDVPDWFVAVSL